MYTDNFKPRFGYLFQHDEEWVSQSCIPELVTDLIYFCSFCCGSKVSIVQIFLIVSLCSHLASSPGVMLVRHLGRGRNLAFYMIVHWSMVLFGVICVHISLPLYSVCSTHHVFLCLLGKCVHHAFVCFTLSSCLVLYCCSGYGFHFIWKKNCNKKKLQHFTDRLR